MKKWRKTLKRAHTHLHLHTHTFFANWCTDAASLETLQPSFSCRASNSQRRDGEPLAEQNRNEEKRNRKRQSRTGSFLSSSAPQVAFFLNQQEIRQVNKIKKGIVSVYFPDKCRPTHLRRNPKSSIFLLHEYPSLQTFCRRCLILLGIPFLIYCIQSDFKAF